MGSTVVNVNDHPYRERKYLPDGREVIPGLGPVRVDVPSGSKSKFFGDPEEGPWIYQLELPAGTNVARHAHRADRVEFMIEGEIEWSEDNAEPRVYGAGTLSHVTAGTFYQYRVLKDARILLWFADRPGDTRK
jgi:hypothetical protein